jgi:hypothetical protein
MLADSAEKFHKATVLAQEASDRLCEAWQLLADVKADKESPLILKVTASDLQDHIDAAGRNLGTAKMGKAIPDPDDGALEAFDEAAVRAGYFDE